MRKNWHLNRKNSNSVQKIGKQRNRDKEDMSSKENRLQEQANSTSLQKTSEIVAKMYNKEKNKMDSRASMVSKAFVLL